MPDPRFYRRSGPFTLRDLVIRVQAEGDFSSAADMLIADVAPLDTATPNDISAFWDPGDVRAVLRTRAGAVVTHYAFSGHILPGSRQVLLVRFPRLAFAQLGQLFYPPASLDAGIDAAAKVDASARVGPGCQIDGGVVVGPQAEIGARCHIASNAVIGKGVAIGEGCRIGSNTTINYALIGNGVYIASNVSVGGQGFGFANGERGPERMPQLGRVVIEDGVEIGANCSIDRGSADDTVIGARSKLDNLVHVAHNVRIGSGCVIAGQVVIAGSSVIGDGVFIGGQAGVSDHVTVGARARIAAGSGVIRDVAERSAVGGYPAVPIRQWHRQTVELRRRAEKQPQI